MSQPTIYLGNSEKSGLFWKNSCNLCIWFTLTIPNLYNFQVPIIWQSVCGKCLCCSAGRLILPAFSGKRDPSLPKLPQIWVTKGLTVYCSTQPNPNLSHSFLNLLSNQARPACRPGLVWQKIQESRLLTTVAGTHYYEYCKLRYLWT